MSCIKAKKGADLVFEFIVTDEAYSPIDITGYTITSTAKDIKMNTLGTGAITITDSANGKFDVKYSGTDVVSWNVDKFQFDVKADSGSQVEYSETISVLLDEAIT